MSSGSGESALRRSERPEPYAGVSLAVISPEDLIVNKTIAGRAQDRADLGAVVETLALAERPLDWPYIERWCDTWDVRERLDHRRAEIGA